MRDVDAQINDAKNQQIDKWSRPCSVFITFQLEEGIQRALNMDEVISKDPEQYGYLNEWFGDESIEIQPASEPSDIIWEHRHFTPKQRFKKAVCVGLVVFLMLSISFVVIFVAQVYSMNLMSVYPVVNCNEFSVYGNTLPKLAMDEYKVNTNKAANGEDVTYTGYLQCYCADTVTDGTTPEDYEGTNICEAYWYNTWVVLAVTNAVTYFIVIVNTIIKGYVISLITWIGYDTHSEQMTKITNGVFISLFFNTAFLLTLTNANFSQYHLPLKNWFVGPYDDYSPAWYVYVANTLTQTMIINAFFQTFF